MIAAVDPGIRGCGVAIFSSSAPRLDWAGYVRNPMESGDNLDRSRSMARAVVMEENELIRAGIVGCSPIALVVEWPRIYMPGKSKGNNADLLYLTCVAGALAAWHGEQVRAVHPDAWKGQVPKTVMAGRIRMRLQPDEVARIRPCAASLEHNVLDAIGIGLWAVGRWS